MDGFGIKVTHDGCLALKQRKKNKPNRQCGSLFKKDKFPS